MSARPAPVRFRLLAALTVLSLASGPFAPAQAAAPQAKGLTISVVRPEKQELHDTLLVTGSLLPREEIQVGPEIEGYRLTEILAEVGDTVQKGQVLARLSRDVLDTQLAQNTANAAKARATIAQQRAALDQALAQETEANSAVERTRQLRKTGVSTQETLDERERAVKVTAAQVVAARESLKAAEADAVLVQAQRAELELKLQRTEVRAPEAGLILARDARIGAIALSTRSEPLFRIAKDGAIDLDAEVPEVALPRLAVGQTVAVTPAGFNRSVEGKVRLISAEVDKATRLGRAKIACPPSPTCAGRLRPRRGPAGPPLGPFGAAVRGHVRRQRRLHPRCEGRRHPRAPRAHGHQDRRARGAHRRRPAGRSRRGARGRFPARRRQGHAGRGWQERERGPLMALNVSAWAIRKPIPSLVLFVVLTALGLVHFRSLPVTQMPNIDIPIVMVTISQPGAAPSELETQVTKKVENAIAGVAGVKHITSSISDGTSVTTVEFHLETMVDRAVNDSRDAVTKIRSELPQSIEEPQVQRVDIEGLPIVTYAVSAPP